jgi:hypothetical protein
MLTNGLLFAIVFVATNGAWTCVCVCVCLVKNHVFSNVVVVFFLVFKY